MARRIQGQTSYGPTLMGAPAYGAYGTDRVNGPSSDEIAAGIRAVMKARDCGALSEEQATDILKALVTAYVSECISLQVGNYIENGLSRMLERQAEEWHTLGRG